MIGGGEYQDYNKAPEIGTWTIYQTINTPTAPLTTGITAGALELDWGPDKKVFQISAANFREKPEKYTGHAYNDPENLLYREIFKHAQVFIGYRLNSDGTKAKADGLGEAVYAGAPGNNITVSVLENVNQKGKYDVSTYFNGILKDFQSVKGLTQKTVTVAKKGNQSNESLDKPSATITAESNVVTVTYADMVSSYPTTATKVTKDGQAVEANIDIKSNGLVDTITFQEGTEDGTYKVEAIIKGADEKTLTSTEITKAESEYTKGEDTPGEAPEAPKATIEFAEKDVTVSFSDTLVDYPSTVIEVEPVTGVNVTSKKVTFTEEAESTDYTIKAYLKKSSAEKKLVATVQATVTVNETGVAGADGSLIKDNDFVVFEDGIIEPNAGYVFEGGSTSTTTTVEDHNNALNTLEPYFFNEIFCNSTDDTVKELYCSWIKRVRSERGKYCRLWVYDYVQADNEAISSIKNPVIGVGNEGDLVCWAAGYASNIDLSIEMTNKAYDGELEIYTDYPAVQVPFLVGQGNFMFHNIAIDDVRTYTDINTLQTYTSEHGNQLADNKVVRVVDYIHNTLQSQINDLDIGTVKNNPKGRTVIWNRAIDILSELWKAEVLDSFASSDVTIEAVPDDKNGVRMIEAIDITGIVRRVYIKTEIA